MKSIVQSLLMLALLGVLLSEAQAQDVEGELLSPEQAFRISAKAPEADLAQVHLSVAQGYYLYRSKLRFKSENPGVSLGEPKLPAGKTKHDEFFGDLEIYRGDVWIALPLQRTDPKVTHLRLAVTSQGCADLGVCYPPQTTTLDVALPAPAPASQKIIDLGTRLGLGDDSGGFLPPDEAFKLTADVQDSKTLLAHWKIADGYYLYKKKIKLTLGEAPGLGIESVDLPAGEIKNDEYFGRLEVYHHDTTVRIRLAGEPGAASALTLKATYQGCAEAGICYPPIDRQIALALPAEATPPAPATRAAATHAPPAQSTEPAPAGPPMSEQDSIADTLAHASTVAVVLSFFGFGLLLAFTPCVFPMIPILSSIIVGQGSALTTRKAFVLSLVYVLAMAATYTVAGVVAALFGQNLQAELQSPWVLGGFSAVFVLLALSMFGFYELQLPASLQTKLSQLSSRQQGGSLVGVAIMGLLSALIVGPCVAPPLAGALIYIGQSGDAVLGGLALFAMGLGMGAPLLLLGTSAGKLLPNAGKWMDAVKAVFGVLLLGVAIWLLERVLPAALAMLLWAGLLIVTAIYLGALEPVASKSGWHRLWKGLGWVLLLYGALLLVGVAGGSRDVFQPLKGVTAIGGDLPGAGAGFRRVASAEDLDAQLGAARAADKPAILDFYADWCVECVRMENTTFRDPATRQALAGVVLLRADVTGNTPSDKALMHRFGLIGPPAILFFGRDGRERRPYRLVGYRSPEEFRRYVGAALQ